MADTTGKDQTEALGLPVVGQEGDTCEQCGSALATDQRYCLNCGRRRGESRVDYEQRLNGGTYTANGAAPAAPVATGNSQWTPGFAILAIALLGVMLLLGVLIGKKGNNNTQTVPAQAAPTTTSAAAAPTDTTATTASKTAKSAKGGGSGTAPGAGNVVQGGKPAALDPNGKAGGGSGATCVGC